MKFNDVLAHCLMGVMSYYHTCGLPTKPEELEALNQMVLCHNMDDLITNLELQGFGEKDNENVYSWICIFIIDNPEGN